MLPASCARDSARGGTRRMESTREGGGGREGNCARERERERERESGTARDNVNVCVVAPKHSQRTDGD